MSLLQLQQSRQQLVSIQRRGRCQKTRFTQQCSVSLLFAAFCLWVYQANCLQTFAAKPTTDRVSFNRDIRPILSDTCFQCHGPDAKTREADLRLDERENAVADLGGYAAIVPGQPDRSEIIARITSTDPELRMPPAHTKKQVTPEQLELLRRWIEQGAEYERHWSFLPISRPVPPQLDDKWVRNGIDRFIVRELQSAGLQPSPPADPYTLVKRLHLDLIGLLPAPEVVEEFVRDYRNEPDAAVRRMTRELLDSPHYGERWGRYWLDQARYADSHGYTIDGDRTMWPYRDWVIQALNRDLPFDQFTIEQLAGDLLPEPTKSQLVATGFHRNTLINQEGGTDNEQFRNEEVVDRVNTTGAVWLGLTVGCAQCHNHKFDALSQREYFQLFAFFNHTADVNNVGPTVAVREGELLLQDAPPKLLEELAAAEQNLKQVVASRAKRQSDWESRWLADTDRHAPADWRPLKLAEFSAPGGAVAEQLEDQSLLVTQGAAQETYQVRFEPAEYPIAALRLRVLTHESLPKNGPGRASNGNFLLSEFEVREGDRLLGIARVEADHAQPKFPITTTVDGDLGTGWAINVGKESRPGARMNADHEAHYVLDEPLAAAGQPLTVTMRHAINNGYNIGRFLIDAAPAAPPPIFESELNDALATPDKQRSDEQRKLIASEFDKVDAARRAAEERLKKVRHELGLGAQVQAMIMQELATPRETFVHIRGDFLRKDRDSGPLQPGVPAALPNMPASETRHTRLDLARWLVSPDHPLTARVTVNRMWMRYFGTGLVQTENDFGTQGAFPTHPDLLDWLAGELIRDGWSMKRLHELIVTSATYRQSSRHRDEADQVDPLNRLLSRQERLRVDAEIIRDLALSASGLLNPELGGPSVRPPQPDGVYAFTQTRKNWTVDSGSDRYRRAMYTRFYRSAPYPMLTTFDSPDFQSVCTRRPRSNTPLQSLTMANDAALFEMMQGLAVRLLKDVSGTDETSDRQRVRRAFLLCFARPPADQEVTAVLQFLNEQRAAFSEQPEAARSVRPAATPDNCSDTTAAAWTSVARALMNTDEFITRE